MFSIIKLYEYLIEKINRKFKLRETLCDYNKLLFYALVLFALFMLIPLLMAGVYNHMSGDDWYNARITYSFILNNNFNLFDFINDCFHDLCNIYVDWSFTYTGYILAYLMPAGFGDQFTWMHTFILLGLFVSVTYVSLTKLISRLFQTDKITYRSIAILIIIYLIQYMPSPFDAFYWYSGSINNLVGFLISILSIAYLCKVVYESTKVTILNWIIFGIGLFFIAGTSYAAVLMLLCSMMLFLIDFIFRKSTYQKNRITYYFMFILYILSILFAISAPGNANRSRLEAGIYGLSAFSSIIRAYLEGVKLIYEHLNINYLFFLIMICILLLPSLVKNRKRFKCPILVTIISYSIYVTSFIPTLYASGIPGELRVRNIQYAYAILFLTFNIVYYLGWYLNKKNVEFVPIVFAQYKKEILVISFGIIMLFMLKGECEPASKVALKGIVSGELRQFDLEVDEREDIFNENINKEVEVSTLTNIPQLFTGYTDLRDRKFWINANVREYYHLSGLKTSMDSQ